MKIGREHTLPQMVTLSQIFDSVDRNTGYQLPPNLRILMRGGFDRMKLGWIKRRSAHVEGTLGAGVEAYVELNEPNDDAETAIRMRTLAVSMLILGQRGVLIGRRTREVHYRRLYG